MSHAEIVKEAERLFKVHRRDILGSSRYGFVVQVRHAVFLALRLRGNSFPQVGRYLDRDHSTIIYGCRKAHAQMQIDPEYREKIKALVEWKPTPVKLPKAAPKNEFLLEDAW